MAKIRRVNSADVLFQGKMIGALAWNPDREIASFEYTDAGLNAPFALSPLMMPRERRIFSFPDLNKKTFFGLPGMLADSLPDRFGNALIDAWLVQHNRPANDFSPVERLCYIGSRGLGALEYRPSLRRAERNSVPLEIEELVRLAQEVMDSRAGMRVTLSGKPKAIETIIRIGTSAGGARAKAIVSWNRETNDIRSGQVPPPPGFESWILKFDGVKDQALGDSEAYGRIEYAYHRMATQAKIEMSECHLLEEHGRAHFMTKRFDRGLDGAKIHMQSLCAIAHFDFNMAGIYAYEQCLDVLLKLGLGYDALEQMYRRLIFNVVARNQDDHTKNIAFLMDDNGLWRLAPAFDMIWAYNPSGLWTNQHQMSVNGKRDGFELNDFLTVAARYGISHPRGIINEVVQSVSSWTKIALEQSIPQPLIDRIAATHLLSF
jgi:serine/threonine-protein kinase HipA